MAELPSGTVTFLFTDIERSTETVAALGDERYADAQEQHRKLLREAFAAHHGVEVGTEGDAFFVAFARARDAVAAAVDGQLALNGYPLRVRMGMHTGEALVREGDYVGHDVHKAKRVSDAGHGGQILLSQTTADLVHDSFFVIDLGSHRLKDLGDAQRLFQVKAEGIETEFPRLRSIESFSTNLPLLRSEFIGREREIATVRELLGRHRLVTLTGIGGCGKTRLSQQVGAELLDEFADGVFFVELAPLDDPSTVVRAVLDSLGRTGPLSGSGITGAAETSDESLLSYLSDRACLIILDNCEHLLDASAEIVDRIQSRCPGITILATSRESLGVDGEQAWGVPSLSLPEEQRTDSEAVSLFASRARAARSGFALSVQDSKTVAEICRRLDGIPLAIEFAAARVTHLSVQQIAEKLDDRFRLLTGGRRHVQRQQTLQAALDWSYDLLSDSERILLRRLAVFPADFDLAAAEEVCSDSSLDARSITDLIGSLVAKSLVDLEPPEFGADEDATRMINAIVGDEARYRLLETVRAYAADRLAQAQEAEIFRTRHRDGFLRWIESFDWPDHLAPAGGFYIRREKANLRAAVDLSSSEGRADMICRFFARASSLLWPLGNSFHSFLDRNDDLYELVVSEAHKLDDPDLRAACLMGRLSVGGVATGYASITEAVEIARTGHPALLTTALAQRAFIGAFIAASTQDQALVEAVLADQAEALELCRDDWPELAPCIRFLAGANEMTLGHHPVELLEDAIADMFAPRLEPMAYVARLYLGACFYGLGDFARAAAAVELFARANLRETTDVIGVIGTIAALTAKTDPTFAKQLLRTHARNAVRATPPDVVEWVHGAATVDLWIGDPERAARLLSFVRASTLDVGLPMRTAAMFAIYRRNVQIVRERLGAETAHRCRDEGRTMSLEEAIAHAEEAIRA